MPVFREDELTQRERRYVDNVRLGMDLVPAARAAGWSDPKHAVARCRERAIVQKELAKVYASARRKATVTRDQVLEGFKEAIQDAKLLGDPATQIKGWTEIGKMCGFYAPEKVEVTVEMTDSELAKKIDSMSTEELLKIAQQDSLEVIEAEYDIVEDGDD